jgi:hypothetical protein
VRVQVQNGPFLELPIWTCNSIQSRSYDDSTIRFHEALRSQPEVSRRKQKEYSYARYHKIPPAFFGLTKVAIGEPVPDITRRQQKPER